MKQQRGRRKKLSDNDNKRRREAIQTEYDKTDNESE